MMGRERETSSLDANVTQLEEGFVDISFSDRQSSNAKADSEGSFPDFARDLASGKHSSPPITCAHALRELYPKHSLAMTQDYRVNVLNFPEAYSMPLKPSDMVTNLVFVPFARRGPVPGALADSVEFGAFQVAWKTYEYTVYVLKYIIGFSMFSQTFVLHEGAEQPARDLILASAAWANALHQEIWIFNQGFWRKDHSLWIELQKASWDDVILDDKFKKALQKDIYGFFESEGIYKDLAIPWKRGIIMHGPPGNGKTISIKAVMKSCEDLGYAPLYVKSFQSYKGEEGAMQDVFSHARQMAPCLIVLEDLDSLINDRNRSFFLNQLDGLEGNDGLLVVGTTNHFDRLDPGLSTRPSRFDRKYLFDDPNKEERTLYALYWQGKLKNKNSVSFPDDLVQEIVDLTDGFSFAYLKEAFVSSLVLMAGFEDDDKRSFESVIKETIKTLREQLDKDPAPKAAPYTPTLLGRRSTAFVSQSSRPLPVAVPSHNAGQQAAVQLHEQAYRRIMAGGNSERTYISSNTAEWELKKFQHLLDNLAEPSQPQYSARNGFQPAANYMPGSMPGAVNLEEMVRRKAE